MIEGTWLALRVAALVLTLQAAGMALFTVLFARVFLPAAVRRSGARVACAAFVLVGLQLLAEPAHLALGWAAIADPAMLRLAAASASTWTLAVRALGLLCILAGIRSAALRLAGIAVVLVSFAVSGHSVGHEHRAVLAAILIVHVAIVAFWLGALAPLRLVLVREAAGPAAQLLREFSRLAVWLVPVIALAGLSLALLLLPDAASLLQPYGLLLLVKVVLFAVLMGIAGLNRLRLVPALTRGEPGAAKSLARSIGIEWFLICGVLAVTAVMTGSFSPD
jgi:putative copper resistance protein D